MSELEDIFCGGRVAILRELAAVEGLTVNELHRRTGLNRQCIRDHLKILRVAGIVRAKSFGRTRLVCFNEDSGRALGLRQFIVAYNQLK